MIENTDYFINGKWWFDLLSITYGKGQFRVQLDDGSYKKILIPIEKFLKNESGYQIDQNWLIKQYGSIVTKFKKSVNTYKVFEDGMGSVSMAGLSGSPGQPGSAGSGDVSGNYFGPFIKSGTYGLEDISKNINTLKKLTKGGHITKINKDKKRIKKPLLSILKEDVSEADFLKKLYDFLDYPWSNNTDTNIVDIINEWRTDFTKTSSQRIQQYLKDLWKFNLFLIKNNCSDQFISNYMVIANIEN